MMLPIVNILKKILGETIIIREAIKCWEVQLMGILMI